MNISYTNERAQPGTFELTIESSYSSLRYTLLAILASYNTWRKLLSAVPGFDGALRIRSILCLQDPDIYRDLQHRSFQASHILRGYSL
jgi:hypothetical protein